MYKQLINTENGEFTINDGFIVSNQTTLNDLLLHFGKEKLIESKNMAKDYCGYYRTSQLEIDGLFFKFSFEFKDEILKIIYFEIETEPKERIEWTFNHVFETDWIKAQTNDKTEFNWNNISPGNSSYFVGYNWGNVGVFFDPFGGYFTTSLSYMQ
jgi:hypothetical protein